MRKIWNISAINKIKGERLHIALSILPLIAAFILFTGCRRDELCFEHNNGAGIELKIDWTRSGVDANSATALIYKDGAYYSKEIFSVYPPVSKIIKLPVGLYDFIVYNEQESDFENSLYFSENRSWDSFEVGAVDDNRYERIVTRALKLPADTLAVDRIKGFKVTADMAGNSHERPVPKDEAVGNKPAVHSITFTPRRIFTDVRIELNVLNGKGYYFSQRTPAVLQGMSGAYFPGTDIYSSDAVSYALTMIPVPERQSNKSVVFEGSLLSVGLAGRIGTGAAEITDNYILSLPFVYNGGLEQRDITIKKDALKCQFIPEDPSDPTNNCDRLIIEVAIELPELIPVGDMQVGVEDWNDVDIPLDGPQRLHFVANNGSSESFWQTNIAGVYINMPASTIFTPVTGLRFVEWNTAADGTGTSYKAGDAFEMKRGGCIFYAIWEKL